MKVDKSARAHSGVAHAQEGRTMMLEVVAFYYEHEQSVELFVAIDEGDDVAWVRVSEHLGERGGRGGDGELGYLDRPCPTEEPRPI